MSHEGSDGVSTLTSRPTSTPTPSTGRGQWLRPSVSLPVIVALLLLALLFAPHDSQQTETRLTTYSAAPFGARGLYESLHQLGFHVERRLTPFSDSIRRDAIYVILAPPIRLTTFEVQRLLNAVHQGAGVILVAQDDSLTDALGFALDDVPFFFFTPHELTAAGDTAVATPGSLDPLNPLDSLGIPPDLLWQQDLVIPGAITVDREDRQTQAFLWFGKEGFVGHRAGAHNQPHTRSNATPKGAPSSTALMAGHAVGHGQATALASRALLFNHVVREGRTAIAFVRALEWMNAQHRPIIFDEYHQGYGVHADVLRAIFRALTEVPAGRMTLQLLIAALVLLAALSIRPLSPAIQHSEARRSPIEHVSALAAAYSQTDARRLGADRLLHGLRRRHPLGLARHHSQTQYLATMRIRFPNLQAEIATLDRTLNQTPNGTPLDQFSTIVTAVAQIEKTIGDHTRD